MTRCQAPALAVTRAAAGSSCSNSWRCRTDTDSNARPTERAIEHTQEQQARTSVCFKSSDVSRVEGRWLRKSVVPGRSSLKQKLGTVNGETRS